MPTPTISVEKLEKLINKAKNPKQKKMYESMLEKVLKTTETEQKPQAKPEQERIYHAVGVICGEISFDDEGKGSIILDGNSYPLFGIIKHKAAIKHLENIVKKTGKKIQQLIVYPKILHLPNRNEPHQVGFNVLGFRGNKIYKQPTLTSKLRDREFLLSGIWQFIPCCKCPVITSRRNYTKKAYTEYKDMEQDIQAIYAKPQHIPVYWRDAKVEPYRHDRNKKDGEQMPSYFVETKVLFLPKQNAFGFRELLGEPTTEHPRYIAQPSKR